MYGHDIEINTASTLITTASINITTVEPVTTANAPITTAGVFVSTAEASTPPTTTILIEDEDLTIDQTLMKIRTMMEADYELAQRLQAEDRKELTIEERSELFVELMDKRKKHFIKLRAEEIRRKPPTKAQKRNQMCTYLRNMANYKHSQLKNKSFEEIQMLFDNTMKWVDLFVPMDSEVVKGSKSQAEGSKKRARKELDEESVKRQKLEDDVEKAKLKACLEIVPNDDSTVNIIRADGSAKFYKIFSAMLDDFDRQDVLDLYRLVKERFKTTSPEGYDILLWGDLITLFKPNLSSYSTRSEEMFEYILLMKIKLLIKKLKDSEVMIITTAGYVSTAGEVERKYSKSILLLVVKLLLLVLVTTARRVFAVRV
ncbi:hypothetical protein Tco_0655571 [Tanacetum coccineum]|uniref:Uncharacterized protein n=1 Tax=Tanacetum coccineum TaxID=301880 RepID=A0ABQ4X6P8_9ASTR